MATGKSTERPKALPFNAAGVPASLKAHARWCVWKYVERNGAWSKMPINARTGGGAQSNNRSTWSSYEEAHDALLHVAELAGLGFFLGDNFVGVDVDDCYNWIDGYSDLARSVLSAVAGYAETSPSGEGLKIITLGTIPQSKANHKLGLEVYDRTRFFAITGAAIGDRENDLPAQPIDLTAFYVQHFGAFAAPSIDDEDLSALQNAKGPLAGWDLDRVRDELLPHLSADCHYSEWLEVGAALHHQGEGDDDWLELWDEWSATAGERFTLGLCAEKWETFGSHLQGRGAVTLASVIHRVKQLRAVKKFDRVTHWTLQITATQDRAQLLDELPRLISRDLLVDEKAREELAQMLKRRLKLVIQTSYSITVVRKWLRPEVSPDLLDCSPEWVKRYVYVTDEDKFFDMARKIRFSRQSFNLLHNRDMPKDDSGNPVKQAADGASDMYGIRVVDSALYQPAAGLFFEMEGRTCVNSYDASVVPDMPPVLLDEEERAVAVVQRHLVNILPDERERQLFLNWLAFVVQNPGVKIRWAPYLCGVPGDGKSFFATLLAACMGSRHVKTLSGDMLANGSGFSDWAVDRCVTVIEEAKLHGGNKFDAANRIKPFITNPVIDVHPKGRASYNAPNTVQYMIASNYLDGVPITADDRRFMFLMTPYTADSLRLFKEAHPDYDTHLFDAVAGFPGAMRFWLYHFHDWHADFNPNANAPITAMRGLVIDMSESDTDSACRSVYESQPPGVTESWVAASLFVEGVEAELGQHSGLKRSQIARICADYLRAKGYAYMGDVRHRVGPSRVQSRFWCERSSVPDCLNWWPEAEKAMKKSFADSVAADFLN